MGGCTSTRQNEVRDAANCAVLNNSWVDEPCLENRGLDTLFGLSRKECLGEDLKRNIRRGSLTAALCYIPV